MSSIPGNLYSFTMHEKNEHGGTTVYYDGVNAGDMIASVVSDSFVAISDSQAADIIANSHHEVEGAHYDEDYSEQFRAFVWHISMPQQHYAVLGTKDKRDAFRGKIFDLQLPVLEPVNDIIFRLEESSDPDWRGRAKALVEKEQLRAPSEATTLKSEDSETPRVMDPCVDRRKVFVIHGRDAAFTQAMLDFLRALDLAPVEWSEAVALTGKTTPYTSEVIDRALSVARGVIVLLTPDNEGRLRQGLWDVNESEQEKQLRYYPRQNVIYEAGLAFGLASDRTIIVKAGPVSITSDLHGLNYVDFDGGKESRVRLVARLRIADCALNTNGEAWLSSGTFPNYSDLSLAEPQRGARRSRIKAGITLKEAKEAMSLAINRLSDEDEGARRLGMLSVTEIDPDNRIFLRVPPRENALIKRVPALQKAMRAILEEDVELRPVMALY